MKRFISFFVVLAALWLAGCGLTDSEGGDGDTEGGDGTETVVVRD